VTRSLAHLQMFNGHTLLDLYQASNEIHRRTLPCIRQFLISNSRSDSGSPGKDLYGFPQAYQKNSNTVFTITTLPISFASFPISDLLIFLTFFLFKASRYQQH
jgi:hypothetical protein